VRTGHSVLSALHADRQRETGLGSVPVTIGASHDTAAAFMTQPPEEDGAILSSGTWSMLGVHLPRPVFPASIDPTRFGHEGNPDGTVRLLCNIPGMWILEQCMESWRRRGIDHSYETLARGAEECAAFTTRIDPYDPAFALPEDMPTAIRAHCIRTGQQEPRTPFETARSIFLGLAECYDAALRELSTLSGLSIRRVRVIGGGSRNLLLNALFQERSGVEVVRGQPEATALGNIMSQEMALAARGAGRN
jgi:rhamnulokinase